jgi:uncharacterized membrane protein YuzA (DUF378 family)
MKKLLAMGIIVLFIGVATAPSINSSIVKASNDNDLVEVTSQACGIQGFGNTTVKLTKQQYQDLEQYLVDFRARLNQTTTREEAIPIYKDAVVELNKYGLLPKGMSIEQAQLLVTGEYISPNLRQRCSEILQKSPEINDKNQSFLCMLFGVTETFETKFFRGITTRMLAPLAIFFSPLIEFLANLWYNIVSNLIGPYGSVIFTILYTIVGIFLLTVYNRPLLFLSAISLTKATGYVNAVGINGKKNWTGGYLTGDIYGPYLHKLNIYPGIIGFTGIKLIPIFDDNHFYYFGFAFRVNIITSSS